jgi:hypothetical protein
MIGDLAEQDLTLFSFNRFCGAPRAEAHASSTCFVGRNPPKHTLLRSFGASKGTLLAFIHGLKTRGFLRRRVKLLAFFRN